MLGDDANLHALKNVDDVFVHFICNCPGFKHMDFVEIEEVLHEGHSDYLNDEQIREGPPVGLLSNDHSDRLLLFVHDRNPEDVDHRESHDVKNTLGV